MSKWIQLLLGRDDLHSAEEVELIREEVKQIKKELMEKAKNDQSCLEKLHDSVLRKLAR